MHFFLLQQYRATVHVCIVTAHTALKSYREQSEVDLLYLLMNHLPEGSYDRGDGEVT